MKGFKAVHRSPVGINIPLETEFTTKNICHVIRRTCDGYSIISTITSHQCQRIRLLDDTTERIEIQASQFPFTTADLRTVQSAGGSAVRYKMLRHTGDAVFLISIDKGNTHFGNKVRVFTKGLFYTSPAKFTGNVQYGRENLMDTNYFGFLSRSFGHALDQSRIEGTPLRQSVRKQRTIILQDSLNAFDRSNNGDSEPCFRQHVLLQFFVHGSTLGGSRTHFVGTAITLTVEYTVYLVQTACAPVLQLQNLFTQCHPSHQVVYTLLDGK